MSIVGAAITVFVFLVLGIEQVLLFGEDHGWWHIR